MTSNTPLPHRPHRSLRTLLALALAPLAAVPVALAVPGPAPAADAAATPASRSARYAATVEVTDHGIPHVTADNFRSLGFGSGYAQSGDALCTLADTLVTARGERSRWFGPDARYNDQVTLQASNLQVDAFVTDLHDRHVVEKLLQDEAAGPGAQARAMVKGYAAGVNAWLRQHRADVSDPACQGAGYLRPDVRPIDVWYGVYLANVLASAGVFVKEIVDATPPSPTDPGLPLPAASAVDRDALLADLGRDPEGAFGSNATAIGSQGLLHRQGHAARQPALPVAGPLPLHPAAPDDPRSLRRRGSLADRLAGGQHRVEQGRGVEPHRLDGLPLHAVRVPARGTAHDLPHRGRARRARAPTPSKITVKKADGSLGTVSEDLYRTPQGFVLDAPDVLMPWTNQSVFALRDANGEHLRTIDTFLDMGKARTVRDLLRRQDQGAGMPWVNTTAADRRGHVLYADHSVVPNVPDSMLPGCETPTGVLLDQLAGLPVLDGTRAMSDCAWRSDADAERPGIFGPGNLPQVRTRDWVMNANDSYWLPNPDHRIEGYDHIIGCEQCVRTMRTRMVSHYVIDRLAKGRQETPRSLRGHEHQNRLMAAEVMRENGALDATCDQTGETEACRALHDWDGHSDRSSRRHPPLRGLRGQPARPGGLPDPVRPGRP